MLYDKILIGSLRHSNSMVRIKVKHQKQKRTLVTTDLEDTWGNSQNILFLGQWCVKNDHALQLHELDYEIISTPKNLEFILADSVEKVTSVEKAIFPILVQRLNEYHGENYSNRFWKIVIGHWLQRYVAICFIAMN